LTFKNGKEEGMSVDERANKVIEMLFGESSNFTIESGE
jgi:hypothetical protein